MPRKKQDRPKRSESEIPLDLTIKRSDGETESETKLSGESESGSPSTSPGLNHSNNNNVSLSIFVSPNPKVKHPTPTPPPPVTTTISRVNSNSNHHSKSSSSSSGSANSKQSKLTNNNNHHSGVKHSSGSNDLRSTKDGGGGSGSGNRQNPWQTQWINRSSEQNRDVFTCVWCKDSFRSLAEMTQHMKASPRCGMAGMQQAAATSTSITSSSSSSTTSSSLSSSSSSSTSTTTTSTTGTYPLTVPSIAAIAAAAAAASASNRGKSTSSIDSLQSLKSSSSPSSASASSMKTSSSVSPSLHHHHLSQQQQPSSPHHQGPTNSTNNNTTTNLPNQNSTKEPMSSSVLAKNSVNLPRKLVRGQDVWLGRGAEQTRQILKCMWCGQSFKTLEDMTRHMRVTQHYTNIISQEQIISWKTPEDKLAQAHVNAVLTCKVCDESFGSLKELSNHIIKNAHYKEHIIRSMTEGGHGRRRQTRERRKKSLPVRKLLELERMELVGKDGAPTGGPSSPGSSSVRCSSSERASSASPLPIQPSHALPPPLPPPPPPPLAHQHSHPSSSSTSTSHHSISSPLNKSSSSSRSAKNDLNNHHHSHSHQGMINATEVAGSGLTGSSRLSSSLSSSSMITCDECNEKLDAKNFIAHIKICKSLPSSSSSSDRKSPCLKSSTSPLPSSPANTSSINNLFSLSLKVPTSSLSNANNSNNSTNNNKDKDRDKDRNNLPSEGSGIKSEPGTGVHASSSSILSSLGLNYKGSADEPLISSGDSPPTTPPTGGSFLSSIEKLIEKSFDSKSRRNQTTGILQRLGIDEEVCPPWQSLSGSASSQNNITGHSESHHSGPSFASWSQQLEKYSFHGLKDRLSASPVPSGASSSYQGTRGENGSLLSTSESSCDDSSSSFDHHSQQAELINANNNKHHRNNKVIESNVGSALQASGSPSAAALAAAAAAATTAATAAISPLKTESGAASASTSTVASGNDLSVTPSGSGVAKKSSSSSLAFPMSSMISRLEETIARITGPSSIGSINNNSNNNNRSVKNNSQPSNSPSPSSVHSSNSNPGTPIINHHTHNRSSSSSHRAHSQRTHHSSHSNRSSFHRHQHLPSSALSSPPPPPHSQSLSLLNKLPDVKSTIKRESLSELSEDDNFGPNSPKRRFHRRSEDESAGSPDRSNPVSPESLRSPGLSTPDSIDSDRSQAEDLSKIK